MSLERFFFFLSYEKVHQIGNEDKTSAFAAAKSLRTYMAVGIHEQRPATDVVRGYTALNNKKLRTTTARVA